MNNTQIIRNVLTINDRVNQIESLLKEKGVNPDLLKKSSPSPQTPPVDLSGIKKDIEN